MVCGGFAIGNRLPRWIKSEPFIITVASLGITLASAAGFWLIAVTYPAVNVVSIVAWIVSTDLLCWRYGALYGDNDRQTAAPSSTSSSAFHVHTSD
jgi:hypothetical protein